MVEREAVMSDCNFRKEPEKILASFIRYNAIFLPDDVNARLEEMAEGAEGGERERYNAIFDNIRLAEAKKRPLCQDTGIPQFYIKVGAGFERPGIIKPAIAEAVRLATKETPLRPNCVDVFSGKNSGDNTGEGVPFISWELTEGDRLEIIIYLAGGGSSMPGFSKVLLPSAGLRGVEKEVLSMVCEKGINACPPLIIGVGIANAADAAAELSKKALLRKIGSENSRGEAAAFEKELFEKVNSLGIGPGGLGGRESVLGVSVEAAVHHPATLALGVTFGCWATRRGRLIIDNGGGVTCDTHSGFRGDFTW